VLVGLFVKVTVYGEAATSAKCAISAVPGTTAPIQFAATLKVPPATLPQVRVAAYAGSIDQLNPAEPKAASETTFVLRADVKRAMAPPRGGHYGDELGPCRARFSLAVNRSLATKIPAI